MSPWAKFYAGREGHEYREYVKERYAPFISAIASRLDYHSLVMELGAGTGAITSILAEHHDVDHALFCATDLCEDMIGIARKRMAALDLDVAVFKLDALTDQGHRPDIVHSHGMLEHFDDDTIRRVINNYADAVQVHYVPGLYPEPTFGDERLMSVDAWWKICKPSQIITFNEGLDYALVFE